MNSTNFAVAVTALLWIVVAGALYVWTALALAAVFRKSGEEGWKAWVPIYNQVILFRLGGVSPLFLLLYIAAGPGTIAVWVFQVIACHRINAAFGLGAGTTVLAALLFPVWASVLGFGSARWVGEEAGPRRTGAPASGTAAPSTGLRLPPLSGSMDDLPAFHGRSTHVAPPDPLFATSTDAVAPPAPAPGRPTPFAPTAPPPSTDGPLPPRTARSQSPVPPPPGGWAPAAPASQTAETPPSAQHPEPAAYSTSSRPPVSSVPSASVPPEAPSPFAPEPARDAAPDWSDASAASPRRGMFEPPVTEPPVSEDSEEVTGAVPGAPAPLSALHGTAEPTPPPRLSEGDPPLQRRSAYDEPGQPAVTRPPEPWTPARSALPESEAFADSSGPVSAIAGAPDAGSPRSARSSVSAQTRRPQIPDDPLDETVIARRRRTDWSLIPPDGATPVAIGSDVVLLGRRPSPDPARPGAQLIPIDDGTVSKTHARLELRGDKWYVTDLDSTNGVVFATLMGTEVEATPGVEIEAGDRFLLGDAEIRLVRRSE